MGVWSHEVRNSLSTFQYCLSVFKALGIIAWLVYVECLCYLSSISDSKTHSMIKRHNSAIVLIVKGFREVDMRSQRFVVWQGIGFVIFIGGYHVFHQPCSQWVTILHCKQCFSHSFSNIIVCFHKRKGVQIDRLYNQDIQIKDKSQTQT